MKKSISEVLSFAALLFNFCAVMFVFASCKTNDPPPMVKEYPADVAIAWIRMQQKLFVGTPGLLPHVTGRAYAYTGLTLYESIAPGIPDHQSIAAQLSGELQLPVLAQGENYHWLDSVN